VLFATLAALSLLCVMYARDRGRGWIAAWALVAAACLATHFFAVFVVAPEAAWLLVRRRDGRALAAVASVAAVQAALLPVAVGDGGRGGLAWLSATSTSHRLALVPQQFVTALCSARGT